MSFSQVVQNFMPFVRQTWASACDKYKDGEMEIICMVLGQIVGFYIPAFFYLGIDVLFPEFSRRHRIQQNSKKQPNKEQVWAAIKVTIWNSIWPILLMVVLMYFQNYEESNFAVEKELPSLKTIAFDFAFGIVAREILFYYVHRALHHPRIYKYVHKKHHSYTAPIAFAAEYTHPVEQVLANILPISLPMTLKGTHLFSYTLFFIFELWHAAADHSGYDFAKVPPAQLHDLHHEKFNVNYSTLGVMDWLHGTDVVGWDKPTKQQPATEKESSTFQFSKKLSTGAQEYPVSKLLLSKRD